MADRLFAGQEPVYLTPERFLANKGANPY